MVRTSGLLREDRLEGRIRLLICLGLCVLEFRVQCVLLGLFLLGGVLGIGFVLSLTLFVRIANDLVIGVELRGQAIDSGDFLALLGLGTGDGIHHGLELSQQGLPLSLGLGEDRLEISELLLEGIELLVCGRVSDDLEAVGRERLDLLENPLTRIDQAAGAIGRLLDSFDGLKQGAIGKRCGIEPHRPSRKRERLRRISDQGQDLLPLVLDGLKMRDLGVELVEIGGHLREEIGIALRHQGVGDDIANRVLCVSDNCRGKNEKKCCKEEFHGVGDFDFHKGSVGMSGENGEHARVWHVLDGGVRVFVHRDFEVFL